MIQDKTFVLAFLLFLSLNEISSAEIVVLSSEAGCSKVFDPLRRRINHFQRPTREISLDEFLKLRRDVYLGEGVVSEAELKRRASSIASAEHRKQKLLASVRDGVLQGIIQIAELTPDDLLNDYPDFSRHIKAGTRYYIMGSLATLPLATRAMIALDLIKAGTQILDNENNQFIEEPGISVNHIGKSWKSSSESSIEQVD